MTKISVDVEVRISDYLDVLTDEELGGEVSRRKTVAAEEKLLAEIGCGMAEQPFYVLDKFEEIRDLFKRGLSEDAMTATKAMISEELGCIL